MKFENTEIWGFRHALRGMRNPLESWDKSDNLNSFAPESFIIGKNNLNLAQRLIKAGGEHSKFMRMIHISVDVYAPRYIWSEWDTYSFNTKNSCSTMHRLLNNDKPIELEQFEICEEDIEFWDDTIAKLEELRKEYKDIQSTTKDSKEMNRLLLRAKRMLPEGFIQMRTVDTNYAELRNMYFQRRNHRLPEWSNDFRKWVESLPYAKELICYESDKK